MVGCNRVAATQPVDPLLRQAVLAALPPTIGEGSMRVRLVLCSLAVLTTGVLLGAPAASARGSSPSIVMVALFHGSIRGTTAYPAIRGRASAYETLETDSHSAIRVTLWNARRLSGRRLTVYLHGQFVGRVRVGPRGHAHLVRSTDAGQPVPRLIPGHAKLTVWHRGRIVAWSRLRFTPVPGVRRLGGIPDAKAW